MNGKMGIILATCFMCLISFSGCVTSSTITTYDADGKIIKIEKATSDIVDKITQSTKDKTLIIWEDGWLAYLSISPGTTDDPTPHAKMWGGKLSKGYISIHKDMKDINWDGISKVISATSKNLSITPKGINEEE